MRALSRHLSSFPISPISKNLVILSDMYIKVKVKSGAKREVVEKNSEDNFHISVREKAERNMANNRILEIFRNMHRGKPVKIVSGHHSPSKIISVEEE